MPWLSHSEYVEKDGVDDINARLSELVRSLDLHYFSALFLRPPKDAPFAVENTLHTNYPDEWVQRYMGLRYFEVDPVAKTTRHGARPFIWGQGRFLRGFRKPERLVFNEANEFQISYGLAIPVRGPQGELSVFNLVSTNKSQLKEALKTSHDRILSAAYDTHDLVLKSQQDQLPAAKKVIDLSNRERECLVWTAEGKTAGEIATILNLSDSTVNQHVASASHKMGSSNKHHAAILAIRQGLIA